MRLGCILVCFWYHCVLTQQGWVIGCCYGASTHQHPNKPVTHLCCQPGDSQLTAECKEMSLSGKIKSSVYKHFWRISIDVYGAQHCTTPHYTKVAQDPFPKLCHAKLHVNGHPVISIVVRFCVTQIALVWTRPHILNSVSGWLNIVNLTICVYGPCNQNIYLSIREVAQTGLIVN